MFSVTDGALEHLANAMSRLKNEDAPDRCFRVVQGENAQITLAIGVPDVGDKVFAHKGQIVLALPDALKEANRTLDMQDGKLVLKVEQARPDE